MLNLTLRVARVLAFMLLGLALVLPWYPVPVGLRQTQQGGYSVVFSQPLSTLVFKGVVAVSMVAILVYVWRRFVSPFKRLAFISGMGLFLLVLLATSFAPLTMQRCATIAAHAEWLTNQNFSIVLPTGDSLTEEEYSYQPYEPLVAITDVIPRSFAVMPVPEFTNVLDLHVTQLPQITMWLGYTPGFCQFAGRGWFCGLFGAILLFVSFSRPAKLFPGPSNMPSWRFLGVALIGGTILEGFWLALPLAAGVELHLAHRDASQGEFEAARKHLGRAFVILPSLRCCTDLLFEEGWLDQKTGRSASVESQLVAAIQEEEEHLSARAWTHYLQLLKGRNPEEIRAEAYRGALRVALRDFNSGLEQKGAACLTELLALDPTCIKVNYALQLADLRLHRKTELEQHVAQFETVYNTFESLEKIAPIATAHKRLAELDFDTNDTADLDDQLRATAKQ